MVREWESTTPGMDFAGMGDSYSAAPSAGVKPVEDDTSAPYLYGLPISDTPAVDDFVPSSFNAATEVQFYSTTSSNHSFADNFQPFSGETTNTSLDFQSNYGPFNLHIPVIEYVYVCLFFFLLIFDSV